MLQAADIMCIHLHERDVLDTKHWCPDCEQWRWLLQVEQWPADAVLPVRLMQGWRPSEHQEELAQGGHPEHCGVDHPCDRLCRGLRCVPQRQEDWERRADWHGADDQVPAKQVPVLGSSCGFGSFYLVQMTTVGGFKAPLFPYISLLKCGFNCILVVKKGNSVWFEFVFALVFRAGLLCIGGTIWDLQETREVNSSRSCSVWQIFKFWG